MLYRHSPCPTSRGDSCVRDIPEAPGERSLKPVQAITFTVLDIARDPLKSGPT